MQESRRRLRASQLIKRSPAAQKSVVQSRRPIQVGKRVRNLSVDVVARRGLDSIEYVEALRVQSCPSTMFDASRVAVDKVVREGRAGVLAPLPVFVEDARTASKRRGAHVVRDSLTQWLQPAEASEWRSDRRALFPWRRPSPTY